MRTRERSIVAFLGLLSFLCACAGVQRTARLDLSEPKIELGRTAKNLDQFVTELELSIVALNESGDQLMTIDENRLRDPFPIDAFKHALIACLNTTDTSGDGPPELVTVANRFDVTCPVPAIVALDRKLDRGSAFEKTALNALQNLDTVRVNRSIAQKLLRELPDQLAHTTAFIGARKSELRKTRQNIRRRKADYRPVDFRASLAALDSYEEALETLESRVFEIDAERSEWTELLGNKIDILYKSLTTLGQRVERKRSEADR